MNVFTITHIYTRTLIIVTNKVQFVETSNVYFFYTERNGFAEISENLARAIDEIILKIILLHYKNNYVEWLNIKTLCSIINILQRAT